MTAIMTKPAKKRLDSCVLTRPKWTKIREPRGNHTCGTLIIDDLATDAAVRVENAQQNGQDRYYKTLLGIYRFRWCICPSERIGSLRAL